MYSSESKVLKCARFSLSMALHVTENVSKDGV